MKINENCCILIDFPENSSFLGKEYPTCNFEVFPLFERKNRAAPEQFFATKSEELSEAADIWAVGFILGQLLQRNLDIFDSDLLTGLKYLERIAEVLGKPPDWMLEKLENSHLKELPQFPSDIPPKKLSELFPNQNEQGSDPITEAIDLLLKMLVFNPEQRITVVEALNHPFLAKLHLEDDEVTSYKPSLVGNPFLQSSSSLNCTI